MLLLTEADVDGLLDMRKAIELTEALLLEQAAVQVYAHEPVVLRTSGRDIRVNLGSVVTSHVAAVRAASGSGASLLWDTQDDRLLAIMAYPAGYLRVGATVGLAVDRMARRDARRLAIIGTGTVARSCIEGIAQLRTFERIEVFSRDSSHREEFVAFAKDQCGVNVAPVADPERIIREADVIVLATLAREPVLRGAWLADGVHVTTAGIRNEIDDAAYLRADLVAVTSREHEQYYRSNRAQDNVLMRLVRDGQLNWDRIPELAQIIAGQFTPAGVTIFRESQGGYGDVPLLHWLYQRAVELGRGQTWEID